jgi:hypothetical protein
MRSTLSKMMVAVVFVGTMGIQADAEIRSRSIIVESPSDLPEAAQRNSEAMYLQATGDGRTVLYLEQEQGRSLAILDVSDPSAIRALGQASIDARGPYDFVRALGDSAALIHYRDHSGFAVINFKKVKQPTLTQAPQFPHPAYVESVGHDGLLLTTSNHPMAEAQDPDYQVFDISNPSNPTALAGVQDVQQRLQRPETGTLFLLTNSGLTVIRRPFVEQEHETELLQQRGN